MKPFLTFAMILLLSACVPTVPPLVPTESKEISASATTVPPQTETPSSNATLTATQLSPPLSQPTLQATSRGDELMASDPASVQIGQGRPVLLEFFRYT
ncbi:MAG: hypothetical protein DDG60_06060 [Anaerolineae bacterium]|nr:MAG: hypothetical protein DDG60_06060 [Anaerolineae bacterium]